MTRGPKGYGSITRLHNGKWLVKIPVGKSDNGRTRYRTSTCITKSEANRKRMALMHLRESQMLVAGPRLSFRDYSREVLLNPNDRVSNRTRDGYFRSLEKHVFNVLGGKPLTEISSQELEDLFRRLRARYSASTVNNVRTALSKVFSTALRHDLVKFNPVTRTEKARRGEFDNSQVRPPLSVEEIQAILKAAQGTSFEAFFTLILGTGMRRGEVLGLKWSDIDFEIGTVSIERTIHRESIIQLDGSTCSAVVVRPPKTSQSRRVNQLPPPVLDALIRHQMEQEVARQMAGEDWENSNYVFTHDYGGPLDESNFYKRYLRFFKDNQLRRVRIHDLRH